MSWDVLVLNYAGSPPSDLADLPKDHEPDALGSADYVRDQISRYLPGVDWSDPTWGLYGENGFSIEFNTGKDDPVDSIMLHVRGDDAIPTMLRFAIPCSWSLLDCSTGKFIDPENPSRESSDRHQQFRDHAVDGSGLPIGWVQAPSPLRVYSAEGAIEEHVAALRQLDAEELRKWCLESGVLGLHANGAQLSGCDLSGAILGASDFSYANLTGAILRSANLNGTKMYGADLTDTDLRETNLSAAVLTNACLAGARLNNADFSNINLGECTLIGVNLKDADLTGANLANAVVEREDWWAALAERNATPLDLNSLERSWKVVPAEKLKATSSGVLPPDQPYYQIAPK